VLLYEPNCNKIYATNVKHVDVWFIQHKENQNIMTDKAQNEANYITIILSTYLLLLLLMRFLVA
jgi:hypothetical protein